MISELTEEGKILRDSIRGFVETEFAPHITEWNEAQRFPMEIIPKLAEIYGGCGFIKDYPVEKYYRDVKLCTTGEGTSEIQRMVIARQILG